jgi:hypothetical protein
MTSLLTTSCAGSEAATMALTLTFGTKVSVELVDGVWTE